MKILYASRKYTTLNGTAPKEARERYLSLITIGTDGSFAITAEFQHRDRRLNAFQMCNSDAAVPRRSSRIAEKRRRLAQQNNLTPEIALAVCHANVLISELVQNIAYHCLGATQLRALECVCTAWFTSVSSANSAWQRVALKRFPRLRSIVQQSSAFRHVPYRELYRRQVVAMLGTQNTMSESLNSFLCTVELLAVDQVRVTPSSSWQYLL